MFSGRYEYAIDDKGRLSIPAKFREILVSQYGPGERRAEDDHGAGRTGKEKSAGPADLKLVLTNLDGCIAAYPEREWEELQGRIEASGALKKEAKNFLRFFYSGATECPIDRLGRILIPQSLRNYGAIKKNVVVVGMSKKVEIWAEESWAELVKRATSDIEKMTDIASELGLLRGNEHIPVLLDEVLHNLVDDGDKLLVDATIGGGGHGYHILDAYRGLKLVGIDADVEALALAEVRLSPYKDRVLLRKGNFRDLKRIMREESIDEVDAVLFDLGISFYQMSGMRGFSFNDDAALDMRIDQDEALTAYEVVNRYGYSALTRIIREYGEEGDAARIAHAIMEARKRGPITNAKYLADIIAKEKKGRGKIHPATKTFQALRMEVNRELSNIADGLQDATDIVRSAGRIGVITFHSLEDRMVKTFFKSNPLLSTVTKKPIRPGREELRMNRRARSAKLRIAEKI